MLEPDVTLTDFAITLICGIFAAELWRQRGPFAGAFVRLFTFPGLAALVAGIVHGYVPDTDAGIGSALWVMSLLAVGAASAAMWELVVRITLKKRALRAALGLIGLAWLGYAWWVFAVDRSFAIAVYQYAAATVALLIVLAIGRSRGTVSHAGFGIAGLIVALVAGVLQQLEFSPVPGLLTHNAFFHVLQIAALAALFITAARLRSGVR